MRGGSGGRRRCPRLAALAATAHADTRRWVADQIAVASVRALLAARDPAVTETTYDWREAWRVILRVQPNAIYPDVDTIEVTVDPCDRHNRCG